MLCFSGILFQIPSRLSQSCDIWKSHGTMHCGGKAAMQIDLQSANLFLISIIEINSKNMMAPQDQDSLQSMLAHPGETV